MSKDNGPPQSSWYKQGSGHCVGVQIDSERFFLADYFCESQRYRSLSTFERLAFQTSILRARQDSATRSNRVYEIKLHIL